MDFFPVWNGSLINRLANPRESHHYSLHPDLHTHRLDSPPEILRVSLSVGLHGGRAANLRDNLRDNPWGDPLEDRLDSPRIGHPGNPLHGLRADQQVSPLGDPLGSPVYSPLLNPQGNLPDILRNNPLLNQLYYRPIPQGSLLVDQRDNPLANLRVSPLPSLRVSQQVFQLCTRRRLLVRIFR